MPILVEYGNRVQFKLSIVDGKGFIGNFLKKPQMILINENMEQTVFHYKSVAKPVEGFQDQPFKSQ
jgi:hypothetical protein